MAEDLFQPEETGEGDRFLVDVGAFEGPLDLLLDLARREKIDLAKVSIAALAEQYLLYIEEARKRRLEVAADYLVMAAWLAYLKSRLLLPEAPNGDEPTAEDLAEALARRLRHLEAIRDAGGKLMRLPRLGIDFFPRGGGEGVGVIRTSAYEATLYDLLSAYSHLRQKNALSHVTVRRRPVLALADARSILMRLVGPVSSWTRLDALLTQYLAAPDERKSVTASSFGALLELVREGNADLRQERPFAPLYVRASERGVGHG